MIDPTPWKTLWYPYAGGRVGIQLSIWKDLPIAVLATAVLAGGRSFPVPRQGKSWDVPFGGDEPIGDWLRRAGFSAHQCLSIAEAVREGGV